MADPSTAPPLVPSSIVEAHAKIRPYIHKTPLLTSKTLDAIASHPDPSAFLSTNPPPLTTPSTTTNGHQDTSQTPSAPTFNLYFKCENQQKIGAFKARGAHHALIRLISIHGVEHIRSRGVITHSSGNHAQALALAAHTFGVPSHIVMPSISTPSKIAGTKMYTDNVYFSGSTAEEREAVVTEVQEKTGAILVPPYDHPDIVLGQGTVAFEMEEQLRESRAQEQYLKTALENTSSQTNGKSSSTTNQESSHAQFDAVLTPVGGGGLLGGVATYFSQESSTKKTLVFGTEPSFSGANDIQRGLASRPPTRIPHVNSLTIADGLRTPAGVLNWTIISDETKVAGVYSVSEREIKDALRLVMERLKVWVEPSAVVPVAVVLFCQEFRDEVARLQLEEGGRAWDVGIVLSGGNTTVEAVSKLFAAAEGESEQHKNAERQTAQVGIDGEREAEDVAG